MTDVRVASCSRIRCGMSRPARPARASVPSLRTRAAWAMGAAGVLVRVLSPALLAQLVLAEEAGPLPVIPEPSAWNDTACHSVSVWFSRLGLP
jgi:hypothetical protein